VFAHIGRALDDFCLKFKSYDFNGECPGTIWCPVRHLWCLTSAKNLQKSLNNSGCRLSMDSMESCMESVSMEYWNRIPWKNWRGGGKLSMDYTTSLHGHCPWIPWTLSMDYTTSFHGHCPWIPWTLSMDSMDTLCGFHRQSPWTLLLCPWTRSILSMDRFAEDQVDGQGSVTPAVHWISHFLSHCHSAT